MYKIILKKYNMVLVLIFAMIVTIFTTWDNNSMPTISVHRGGGNAPENTLVAFENAYKKGGRMFECDVQLTKDGIFVLSHDTTIDRTSNGTGRIRDMTLQELKTYDFGSWYSDNFIGIKITTLEEFLEFCKKKMLC